LTIGEGLGVKVNKDRGEELRKLLLKLGLLNKELRIEKEGYYLIIPILREPSPAELASLHKVDPNMEVVRTVFKEVERRPRDLAEALGDVLEPNLLAALPRSFDIVGDIAIIELPPELVEYGEIVAKALMTVHRNVRAVYSKGGAVEGEFRVRPLRHLGGERRTLTVHREHGCVFKVDISKVYFSPRLANERLRVANLVRHEEVVVDMFSGVGPFAIHIARRRKAKVYAIDINPTAYSLLVENVRLNKVEELVEPIHGDAAQVVTTKLRGIADRVIMNHPSQAERFIPYACKALKDEGGVIHYYVFARDLEEVKERFSRGVEAAGRRVLDITYEGYVREVAPRLWQVALDALII